MYVLSTLPKRTTPLTVDRTLGVVRCETGSSSRVRARASPTQHLLRGGYNGAYTRSEADEDIMNALVHLRKKTKVGGGRTGSTSGGPVLETSLWGMLYADDAGVVSQSLEQLRKMMGVIVDIRGLWPHGIEGQD